MASLLNRVGEPLNPAASWSVPMAARARSSTDSPDMRHKSHTTDWNCHEQIAELTAQNDKNEIAFAQCIHKAKVELEHKDKILETIGDILESRLQRWALEEMVDAWRLIAAEELRGKKSQAQGAAECEALEQRKSGRAELTATAARIDAEEVAQEEHGKRQEIHWRRWTSGFSGRWLYESSLNPALRQLLAWNALSKRQSWATRTVSERSAILTMGVLSALVLSWRLQVGTERCESAKRSVQESIAELPVQVKQALHLQGEVLLERCFPAAVVDSVLLSEVLGSWSAVASFAAAWRSRCNNVVDASLRRKEEDTLLAFILLQWRGSVCKAHFFQGQEGRLCQESSLASLQRLQTWMDEATSVMVEAIMHAALIAWQSSAAQKRLQESVEMVFAQCQGEESMTVQRRHELQQVQESLAVATDQWAVESVRLLNTEASLTQEVSSSVFRLAEAKQELESVEALRASAKNEAGQLAAELALAEESLRMSTRQLHRIVETEEAEECEARVVAHEEEAAEARLALEKMEQDLAKQQGRRQRESRDVRQQFRSQINRAKEATHRLQTARAEDQATWADRLQVSLQKRHRLEQEIKTLRKGADEVLPKCSELETENSHLQEQCGDMEARLRHLEVVERGRREELATLRNTRAEWWRRCEALANAPIQFTARSQMPASTRSSGTAGAASATF